MDKKLYLKGKFGKGKYALIDDEDFTRCKYKSWRISHGYVVTKIRGKQISLHNFIMQNNDPEYVIDHINLDKLDNRRCNLRKCLVIENNFNRPKPKNNKSGYKGVTVRANNYQARIYYQKMEINLGRFTFPEDAARAYNEASRKYHKEFGRLNEGV